MLVDEKKVLKALDFWSSYFSRIYNNLDRDDLFQEAYIGTVQTITNEHHIHIAVRCDMLDYIRREFRYKSRFEAHAHETLPEKEEDRNSLILDKLETLNKVIDAAELSPVQKQILFLLYYKHKTMDEVGLTLNVTKSTISIMHKKALEKIRSTFDD
jgi:RNA polymerase sigma factor (sigma-70 family)